MTDERNEWLVVDVWDDPHMTTMEVRNMASNRRLKIKVRRIYDINFGDSVFISGTETTWSQTGDRKKAATLERI